jgi:FAD/FMN-containing dehydrogenase
MDRRSLIVGAGAVALAPGLAATAAAARRVRPGDAGWPSAAQWEGLSRQVGGRLIRPAPLAADCAAGPESAACTALLRNLRNPFFIGDQAGGTQVSGWFDAWTPATSAYAVEAKDADDVAAAVNFARTHRLLVAVKGGGHSYQGTSNAPDSLLVWTRRMHAVTLHDAFVAQGCAAVQAPAPAVTLEAGAMWIDAYDAVTTKAGRYVQGGGCTSVGVAGLVQSGGFGSYSKAFGTAAAWLLEAQIVTADGAVRTVNACRDSELFWAIKGGGGGSFGVVTKLTLRTHDLPAKFGGLDATVRAASDEAFQRLLGGFLGFCESALLSPHWGEQVFVRPGNILKISMVSQGLDEAQQAAIWAPFFAFVRASPGDFSFVEQPDFGAGPSQAWWDVVARRKRGSTALIADDRPGAPAHHAWWDGDQDQVGAYLHGYDSMWLPASLLTADRRDALAAALAEASRHMAVSLHFNKGLAGAPAQALAAARDTATNPGVLGAFALAIIATGGPTQYPGLLGVPSGAALARANAAAVDAAAAALRKVAPRAGSYVSESNYFNADWRQAFWGRNYPRLAAVKARYDPGGLFTVHHGVGSEAWSADGFTRVNSPV